MSKPHRYTSIIIASYIPDGLRAKTFRTSLDSLIETTKDLPVEIIIVDNGGDIDISNYLQKLAKTGSIHCYVYNSENMHFGFARNQGLAMAHGNYVVITDNDILYEQGWLEACLEILEAYPNRKIYATPIDYPTNVMRERYWQGELVLRPGEPKYKLSMRAGSNCFVIRAEDLNKIGGFLYHRIAGTVWTDTAVREGYLAAVTPQNMVKDLGFRVGYNHRQAISIKRILTNGEEVFFNQDEYQIPA